MLVSVSDPIILVKTKVAIRTWIYPQREWLGDMLIGIMQLIGVLLSVTIVGGVMGYAMRRMRRQVAGGGDEETMTSLHLEDR